MNAFMRIRLIERLAPGPDNLWSSGSLFNLCVMINWSFDESVVWVECGWEEFRLKNVAGTAIESLWFLNKKLQKAS